MSELKPCPFCQSQALRMPSSDVQPDGIWQCHVECGSCEARGPNAFWYENDEEAEKAAIASWNAMSVQLAAAPVAAQEPTFWYDPKLVERRELMGDAKQVVITGSNVKWGDYTAPLYPQPAPAQVYESGCYTPRPAPAQGEPHPAEVEAGKRGLASLEAAMQGERQPAGHVHQWEPVEVFGPGVSICACGLSRWPRK